MNRKNKNQKKHWVNIHIYTLGLIKTAQVVGQIVWGYLQKTRSRLLCFALWQKQKKSRTENTAIND